MNLKPKYTAAITTFLLLCIPVILSIISTSIDFDKEEAKEFITNVEDYGKLRSFDDLCRASKFINGIPVHTNPKIHATNHTVYYKYVLSEQNIDERKFEEFRSYLDRTNLREYTRIGDYSVFTVDGQLDAVWGYLYVHSGIKLKKGYVQIENSSYYITEDLGDNWYAF